MVIRVVAHVEDRLINNEGNGTLSGIVIDILNDIHLNSGFIFNITRLVEYANVTDVYEEGDFFSKDVGHRLALNEVDLGANYYFLLRDRAKPMNLSVLLPIVTERFSAFFVQPHAVEGYSIFYTPFGTKIAVLTFVTIVILMMGSVVLLWKSKASESTCGSFMESLRVGIWGIVSAYALKNIPVKQRGTPFKVLVLSSSLFFWVISSAYSAFLMSVLASSMNPIHSFTDLIAQGYSIYINPTISSNVSSALEYKKPFKPVYGNVESYRMALGGGHAHVDQADSFQFYGMGLGLKPSHLCKEIAVVPFLSGISSGFYISRNLNGSTRESLNRSIAKLGDTGLLHYYNKKYFENPSFCPRRPTEYLELGMIHVRSLFEVLGGCGAVAGGFLVIELLVYYTSCMDKIYRRVKRRK